MGGARVNDPNELADRYLSLWNEADAVRRRRLVEELWSEDGLQTLQPPQEMREIARRAGIGMTAVLEAVGHDALEARAASVYGEFVARGAFSFRRRDNVERVADAVKFNWEMVSTDGEVAAVGLEFLLLDGEGRIRRDYVFIES